MNINPGNSEAILHIMCSVGVCLDILLSSESANIILSSDDLSFYMSGKRITINSKETLIYHIVEVLTDPKFINVRNALFDALDNADQESFNIYLAKVHDLQPHGHLSMVPEVLETLREFHADFISGLYILLDHHADDQVKTACKHLIENHLVHIADTNSSAVLDGTFGIFEPPSAEEHTHIYAHLWGAHVYGKESPEQLELINRRIKLNQTLRVGISNKRGIFFKFKEGESFDVAATDMILNEEKLRYGDADVRLFGAINAVVTANAELRKKLQW